MPIAAVVTLAITAVLVAALAVYLIWIALTLRQVDGTLGKVTFGVRAIAHRTAPVNSLVGGINANLEGVAEALEGLVAKLGADDPGAKVG
jgi:hypothetical protein